MRILAGGLALLLIAAPVAAHDFWIEPNRFTVAANAPVGVTFQVGHGAANQRWGLGSDRIVMIADYFGGARRDLRGDLRSGGAADLITRFDRPGLHVVALQSDYALSDLPAIRFNDYAKEEGLALIIATRARTGQTNRPGREKYSRRAKALVQVGPMTRANQALATRPIGLKLEIVPERNPYALGSNRRLPVRVLYKGRPLANATVKLTRLENDERPAGVAVTNAAGRAVFRVPAAGAWQMNVVWGEPVANDRRVDFDTTFSSLTFGYPAAR
ncbi:MAG: DUF4198 domain-containing protein [Pseudomonadota bacterium]|nr:DUF4198 domain-containing protein [Pseudomonadota bacterium]